MEWPVTHIQSQSKTGIPILNDAIPGELQSSCTQFHTYIKFRMGGIVLSRIYQWQKQKKAGVKKHKHFFTGWPH
jgi:hypothetical protein